MKATFFLLLALLSSLNLFSQEDSISNIDQGQEDKIRHFNFTLFIQYGGLNNNLILKETHSSPSFGGGLNISYKINKISIISGFEYQQYAATSKYSNLVFGNQIDPKTGIHLPLYNRIDSIKVQNQLAIPLGIRYAIDVNNRSKINLTIGIAGNISLFQQNKTLKKWNGEIMKREKTNINYPTKLNLSSFYALTYEIRIFSKLQFQIGPKLDIIHSTVNTMPYKFSLFTGLTF